MKDCDLIILKFVIIQPGEQYLGRKDKLVNLYIKTEVPCPSLSHEGECLSIQKIAEWP